MKEKPICVEQGQKLAKEVMQPSQNLKINVNEAEVVVEAEIYRAFTVCQALCRVEGSFWKPPGLTACFVYSTAFYKHTLCAWHGGCWAVGCSLYSSPEHASWEVLAAVPVKQDSSLGKSAWRCLGGLNRLGSGTCAGVRGPCRESLGEGLLSLPAPGTFTVSDPLHRLLRTTYFSIGL